MELNTLVTEPDYSLLNNEFSLPEIPQDNPPVRQKDAYEDAFYAVNPGAKDPVSETAKAAEDLINKGSSDAVDYAKTKWATEQDAVTKKVIGDILQDTSIDKMEKFRILTEYSTGGYVSQSLKDKYTQKVATMPTDHTVEDRRSQDNNIDALPQKLELSINQKQDKVINTLAEDITNKVVKQSSQVNFKNADSVRAFTNQSLDLLKDTILDGIRFGTEGFHKRGLDATGNAAAFWKMVFSSPQWLEDLTLRTTGFLAQGVTGQVPTMKEATALSKQIQNDGAPGSWISKTLNSYIDGWMKDPEVKKAYDEALLTKGFTKLSDKITATGEAVEKKTDGAVSKEAVQYGADLLMLFAPHLIGKGYRVIKKAYQDRMPREGEVLPPEDQGPAGPALDSAPNEPIEGEFEVIYDPITGSDIQVARTQRSAQAERSTSTVTMDSQGALVPTEPSIDLGITPDSPLDVTNQANPVVGGDLAVMALTDETGRVAETLGTDQASIFFSSVLPSLERRYGDLRNNPDLRARLRALEADLQGQIEYGRFDPNALDIYEYYGDKLAIDRVINEQNLPYLRLNESLVNHNNFSLTGSFLFGRNENYFFSTKEQVETAYNNIVNSLEIPPGASSKISILDRKTGELYSFSDFMSSKTYDIAGYEPPQPGYTTLYRGEYTGPSRNSPSWVREINRQSGQSAAAGRWWTPDINVADWYAKDAGRHGRIVYINVPNSFLEQYKVSNSNPIVRQFSRDPEKELFLPASYVGKGKLFERAPSEAHDFAIQWDFSKQYDALASFVDGLAQHQVKLQKYLGGLDVTKMAMEDWADAIFWTAKHPKFVQKGFARQAEKAAFISSKALIAAQKIISNSRNPKILNQLIIYENDHNKPLTEVAEIASLYPSTTHEQRLQLFDELAQFRVLNNHFYNMANVVERYSLTQRKFTSSLNRNKKYLGAVAEEFKLEPGGIDAPDIIKKRGLPKYVYDLDTKTVVPLKLWEGNPKPHGQWSIDGKQIVQLETPYKSTIDFTSWSPDIDGSLIPDQPGRAQMYIHYGLVGTKNRVRPSLPNEVLPYIEGHAPMIYKGQFIVMLEPKIISIDGYEIPDDTDHSNIRLHYREAVAIAQTRKELNAIKRELEDRFGNDYKVLSRLSTDSIKDLKDHLTIHKENLARAKVRGQPLVGLNGARPPIEEPLIAAIESYKHAVRSYAIKDIDYALQKQFLKEYGHLVPSGEFPAKEAEIADNPNFSEQERLTRSKAVSLFRYRQNLESLGNWNGLDGVYQTVLHSIADVLEHVKVPAPVLRELGNKGISPAQAARHLTSTLAITLNPAKQYFVQTSQALVAYGMQAFGLDVKALSKQGAIANSILVDVLLSSYAKPYEAGITALSKRALSWGITEREYDIIREDFKTLIPSANLNLLVSEFISDSTKKLDPTMVEEAIKYTTIVPKTITSLSRKMGFNSAELINRLNLYLFAIQDFKAKNPGVDWTLPATREDLMYESWRLAQGMSKAGAYKWQTDGLFAFAFQFFANGFKSWMSLIVKDSNIYTPKQNAASFAVMLALFGTSAFWATQWLYDRLEEGLDNHEVEINKLVDYKKFRENLKTVTKGSVNYLLNKAAQGATGSKESNIDFSSQISPLAIRPFDTALNIYYAFDSDRDEKPRFPVTNTLDTFGAIFNELNDFYTIKKFGSPEIRDQALSNLVYNLSSEVKGWSNIQKAIVAWTLEDLVDKNGNKFGVHLTKADAAGLAFGFPHAEQNRIIEQLIAEGDDNKVIKELAKQWHAYIMKASLTDDPNKFETRQKRMEEYSAYKAGAEESKKFSTYQLNKLDKEFYRLDVRSQQTLSDSVFNYVVQNHTATENKTVQEATRQVRNWLKDNSMNISNEGRKTIEDILDLFKGRDNGN